MDGWTPRRIEPGSGEPGSHGSAGRAPLCLKLATARRHRRSTMMAPARWCAFHSIPFHASTDLLHPSRLPLALARRFLFLQVGVFFLPGKTRGGWSRWMEVVSFVGISSQKGASSMRSTLVVNNSNLAR
jgi:hypothetical protein